MKLLRHLRTALVCAALVSLYACGSGGGGTATPAGGTLSMAMTDAPACGYDHVYVTVQKVRVNQSSTAADSDAGWSEIVLNPAQRLDLLSLTNGVLSELGQTPLPAGKYTQMRLVLADNGAAAPWANSVVPTGGTTEFPLKTPSGQQSGVKANIDIDIAADQMADFVIDFNACKSVVSAGASGNYLLKPVVTVIPRYISGVKGYVAASLANGDTTVSLQQGGQTVKTTVPDSTGLFMLQPVAPGTYTLVVTVPGATTEIIDNVAVATDSVSPVNLSTTPLDLPASASGTVTGAVSVTPAPASIDASVRALQALTGGSTVEIVSGPVDSVTGSYTYALPVAAPMVASYVAGPGALTFSADAGAAGKYQLEASSGGVVKSVVPVTVTAGATVTTNFTFP